MYQNTSIAVVVPAHNEETQIGRVIETMPDYVDQIIVVDDQSSDDTVNAVKRYCQQPDHLLVARSYSAVTGALTVVIVAVLAALLVPGSPGVSWTAGGLLALSGFHISESQSGTVDALRGLEIRTASLIPETGVRDRR